jgi:ABC-type phosphate transport system permease subunit
VADKPSRSARSKNLELNKNLRRDVDAALTENLAVSNRTISVRRAGRAESRFRVLIQAAAIAVLAIFGGVIVSLIVGAWPALIEFGSTEQVFTTPTKRQTEQIRLDH